MRQTGSSCRGGERRGTRRWRGGSWCRRGCRRRRGSLRVACCSCSRRTSANYRPRRYLRSGVGDGDNERATVTQCMRSFASRTASPVARPRLRRCWRRAWRRLAAPAAGGRSLRPSAAARPGEPSARSCSATLCLLNARAPPPRPAPLTPERPRLGARRPPPRARHGQRNYFSHTSLAGASFVDRIRRAGYLRERARWAVGENIAWGTGALATPRAIVRAWMNSPGTGRTSSTRRFREIGIGVA